MDGILSNGCLIITPGPKQETPTVTPDPYPQPDPQPDPQPAFILTIAVAVAISASIYISTTRRPVSTPFRLDMNPTRREVNEFWDHLKTVVLPGGLPIGKDYSQRLQKFTDHIRYLRVCLDEEETQSNINIVTASDIDYAYASDIDYAYEHFKLKEELQGILDKLKKLQGILDELKKFNDVELSFSHSEYYKDRAISKMRTTLCRRVYVSMYLFSASLLYNLLPIR